MANAGVNSRSGYSTDGLLCDVLEQWCIEQGLPYESADELLAGCEGTEPQQHWLRAYIALWDATVQRAAREALEVAP